MNSFIADILARLTTLPQATYCEHAFLRYPDQPFNVYSNLAFLLAAIMVVMLRGALPSRSSWVIATLSVIVGMTSALWHLTMTPAAQIADMAASAGLALVMAYLVMRYVFYWPLWLCLPALPVLYVLSAGLPLDNETWIAPGSAPLVPAAVLLAVGGFWSAFRHSNAGLYLIMASFWMFGGFVVLGLDKPACEVIPIGTHFGWHLLAAGAILCIARAVAGADIELLDFGRPHDGPKPNEIPPPPEDALSPEDLEKIPHGMPADRVDPREI